MRSPSRTPLGTGLRSRAPGAARGVALRPLARICGRTSIRDEGTTGSGGHVRARDEELHHIDSPLAALRDRIIAPDALAEGPVRFLLISGARDDETWGLIGAFWLSIDGKRGGQVLGDLIERRDRERQMPVLGAVLVLRAGDVLGEPVSVGERHHQVLR